MSFLNESYIDIVNISKDNKLEPIYLGLALRQSYPWVHWPVLWSHNHTLALCPLLMQLLDFLKCTSSILMCHDFNHNISILMTILYHWLCRNKIHWLQQHCYWRCTQIFITANYLENYIESLPKFLLISTLVYGENKIKISKKIYIITFGSLVLIAHQYSHLHGNKTNSY